MQSDVGDETRREAARLVRDHSYCLSSGTNGLGEGQRLDAPPHLHRRRSERRCPAHDQPTRGEKRRCSVGV
jgi:hypothetical protein